MQVIKWSIFWILAAIVVTGSIAYLFGDIALWQMHIRTAGGIFFMIAIVVGGVLTTDSAYRNRKRTFYREEWSFICILVTLCLFGVSYFLS